MNSAAANPEVSDVSCDTGQCRGREAIAEGCAVGRDRLGLGRGLFGTPLVDDTQPQTEVLRFAVDLAPDEMLGFSTVLRELEPKLGMKVVLEYVSTDTQYLQLKKGKGPVTLSRSTSNCCAGS